MIDTDKAEFLRTLNGLALLYGSKLERDALTLWWECMREWALEDFKSAASRLARTSKFMPRPADFTELARAQLPTSGEAWAKVLAWITSGQYRVPNASWSETTARDMGDAAIDAAVRALGGYYVIAHTVRDQLPFLERRFAEHYTAKLDAGEKRGQLEHASAPRLTRDEP